MIGSVLRIGLLIDNIGSRHEFFSPDSEAIVAAVTNTERPHCHPFGYEYSNTAWAVLQGEGISSPFGGRTGPTAWSAPIPVGLYAIAFFFFGPWTRASLLFLFGSALMVSAGTTVAVYGACRALTHRDDLAGFAALGFSLAPTDVWLFRGGEVFDLNLVTAAFAALMWLALMWINQPNLTRSTTLGATIGLCMLVHPGLMLPGLAAAVIGTVHLPRPRAASACLAVMASAGAVVGPYVMIQNSRVGMVSLVKSNLPFELFLGNTTEANGILTATAFREHHPIQNRQAFERYRTVGEATFIREAKRAFRESFDVASFGARCLRRTAFFFFLHIDKGWDTPGLETTAKKILWATPGLVLLGHLFVRNRRMTRGEAAVQVMILAYSAPYLAVSVMDRYKAPMTPALLLLAMIVVRTITRQLGNRDPSMEQPTAPPV